MKIKLNNITALQKFTGEDKRIKLYNKISEWFLKNCGVSLPILKEEFIDKDQWEEVSFKLIDVSDATEEWKYFMYEVVKILTYASYCEGASNRDFCDQ